MECIEKKIVVGISGSIIIDGSGNFAGYKRAYVNDDYVQAVIREGGIPYILPITSDISVIEEFAKNIDVLILSGGHDINPLLWKEEPSKNLGEIFPERDNFDFTLLENMEKLKKPILGICRGEQVINTYFGGTLYQDINSLEWATLKHNQKNRPDLVTHTVNIEKNSKLHEILGEEEILVNSFHHLAVKTVAPGFKAVGFAKDGVVEAIEKQGNNLVLGVQWHPEMLAEKNNIMRKLFKYIINEAKKEKVNER